MFRPLPVMAVPGDVEAAEPDELLVLVPATRERARTASGRVTSSCRASFERSCRRSGGGALSRRAVPARTRRLVRVVRPGASSCDRGWNDDSRRSGQTGLLLASKKRSLKPSHLERRCRWARHHAVERRASRRTGHGFGSVEERARCVVAVRAPAARTGWVVEIVRPVGRPRGNRHDLVLRPDALRDSLRIAVESARWLVPTPSLKRIGGSSASRAMPPLSPISTTKQARPAGADSRPSDRTCRRRSSRTACRWCVSQVGSCRAEANEWSRSVTMLPRERALNRRSSRICAIGSARHWVSTLTDRPCSTSGSCC